MNDAKLPAEYKTTLLDYLQRGDEAGQLPAAVYIALDELARDFPPGERKRIQKIREYLDQIEADLRRLSHELHPTVLDDLGLVAALEFLAKGVSRRTGLRVSVESD